jgi:hypothetical protein
MNAAICASVAGLAESVPRSDDIATGATACRETVCAAVWYSTATASVNGSVPRDVMISPSASEI